MNSGIVQWGRGHVRHGRVPEWLIESDVSDKALRLYTLLALYADEGRVIARREMLAEKMSCSLPTLRMAVKDLERVGALEVVERYTEAGGRRPNEYVLHWSEAQDSYRGGEADLPRERSGDLPPSRARSSVRSFPEEREDHSRTPSDGGEELSPSPGLEKPPKLVKVEGRNLGFDALAEVCGIDPDGNRGAMIAAALNGSKRHGLTVGIRELCWRELMDEARGVYAENSEAFENFVAGRIAHRARQYIEAMDGAMLTPTALAKWWTDLEMVQRKRVEQRRGMSGAEMLRALHQKEESR